MWHWRVNMGRFGQPSLVYHFGFSSRSVCTNLLQSAHWSSPLHRISFDSAVLFIWEWSHIIFSQMIHWLGNNMVYHMCWDYGIYSMANYVGFNFLHQICYWSIGDRPEVLCIQFTVIREINSIYFKCKTQDVIDYTFELEQQRLFIIFDFYLVLRNVDSHPLRVLRDWTLLQI